MGILMEPIKTKSSVIRCDGGGGRLGHPAVFLNLGKEGKIVCPYCSKRYVKVSAYCQLPSGERCPTEDLYNGRCS